MHCGYHGDDCLWEKCEEHGRCYLDVLREEQEGRRAPQASQSEGEEAA